MDIFRTYLFLIPLLVLCLSECTKLLVGRFQTGQWEDHFFHPGGMPSSHSAFVTSLLILVARKTGVESVEFSIAVVYACIVWYDAITVRRALGEQAQVLNRLQHWKHLTEQLGHSIKQVGAGIVFGAAVTQVGIWLS